MSATTALPTKPWADRPCALKTTPQYATKKNDIFTIGATHMAHIHNAILRGYNSIYLQAPYITDSEKSNFIGYALTWYRFVKSHHDDEELELFPKVEEVLSDTTIWTKTHKEHESFLPGLAEYEKYLTNLENPSHFDGHALQKTMQTFQEPFSQHFHSEINTIAQLSSHPNASGSDTPEAEVITGTFKAWGKKTVMKAGTFDVVPFFLMNLDTDYEEGMWKNWPPMPGFVRWGLVNIAGSWNAGWWKFASCDADGKRRELWAVRDMEADEIAELM